jgi:hypothetical protein
MPKLRVTADLPDLILREMAPIALQDDYDRDQDCIHQQE